MPNKNQHQNTINHTSKIVIKKSAGIQKTQHTTHHADLPASHSRTFIPAAQRHRAVMHTSVSAPAARPVVHTQTFVPATTPRPVVHTQTFVPATTPRPVVHTQAFVPATASRPVVHTQAFVPAGSATPVAAAIQLAQTTAAAVSAARTITRPRM